MQQQEKKKEIKQKGDKDGSDEDELGSWHK